MQLVDEDVLQQQQYWDNLVLRIMAGDPAGLTEFRATYRPGIRFLMQRRIGDNRELDAVVDETMRGIVDDIAAGQLTTVAEMARFIRKAIPAERTTTGGTSITEADRERQSSRVRTLDQALEKFTSIEREALISFYARGFNERDVEAEFGYDVVAFRHLRERLVRSLNSARARRAPSSERRTPVLRAAASGAA
jgi:hypothetical protein